MPPRGISPSRQPARRLSEPSGAIWAPAPTGLPAAPTMASWPSRQAATPPSPTCSSMRSIRCRPMVAARSTTDSTTRSTTSRRKIC
ncbi:MAG: hypothetical protein EGR49_01350 [Prevotella sp.]|nr:hypothetical protein [Prevotella sp.]